MSAKTILALDTKTGDQATVYTPPEHLQWLAVDFIKERLADPYRCSGGPQDRVFLDYLLALVESLTAERDALQVGRDRDRVKGAVAVLNEELRTSEQEDRAQKAEAEVERLTEAYQWTDQVLTAVTAERDALIAVGKRQAARLARVEAYVLDELRAALAGSEADTSDTQPTDQEDQS